MLQVFKNTKFDFIRCQKIAYSASILVILIGVVSVIMHRGFNLSVDFIGGTTMQMKFEKPFHDDLGKIRDIISELGFGSPEVKTIGQVVNNELQVTVGKQAEGDIVSKSIKNALTEKYPENSFEVRRVETVGPKIGGELKRDAIVATILSLIAILIYVGFRFNLPFGVASVIPLFHDVLVTLTVFSLLNLEVSLTFIAALLTIVGYSLNDTIVIFDRIRENLKNGLKGKSFTDVVNGSINQTLSRTFITSLTTLFVSFALYLLGSDAIKDFALALTVGVVVGTYSSIFIATSILVAWHNKKPIVK
ncbi:MAG: protein translocase subunit SecF [Fibrobacter sp.]|jgi:preprotein translocase SecF subunit|nr:protein translocase subunit SecF [Fibrobacter sp.]